MITMYGIKNCDSVKKAKKFLDAKGIAYAFVDFKTDPATCEQISSWLEKSDIKTLFNSRSTTYRNLDLKSKNLNDDEKAQWLCQENLLIKRPVIVTPNKVIVGFDNNTYEGEFSNVPAT